MYIVFAMILLFPVFYWINRIKGEIKKEKDEVRIKQENIKREELIRELKDEIKEELRKER